MSCPALQMESRPKYYGREWVSLYYSHLSFMYNCLLLNIGVYEKAHCSCHAVKEIQFVKHGQNFKIKMCLMLLWRATVLGCVTDVRILSCCHTTKLLNETKSTHIYSLLLFAAADACVSSPPLLLLSLVFPRAMVYVTPALNQLCTGCPFSLNLSSLASETVWFSCLNAFTTGRLCCDGSCAQTELQNRL